MQTFFLVAAGVLFGLICFAAIGLGWAKRKVEEVCESLVEPVKAGGIPPFRVHLDQQPTPERLAGDVLAEASKHLESIGYRQAGDFSIREMEGVSIRGFWHEASNFFVSLCDHPQAGVFADAFREYADGTSATISTAPETGLARPPQAHHFRIDGDINHEATAQQLHNRLTHESIGREAVTTCAEEFANVFTKAYAQEMDWRIARGGVTRNEISRVSELGGGGPASETQIEMISQMWSGAIAKFITDEVQRIWLSESELGAADWEVVRDRVSIVHEQLDPEDWIDQLARIMAEAEADPNDDCESEAAYQIARDQAFAVFESRTIRDGFDEAQSLLPEKQRFTKIGSAEEPWPADIWVEPENAGMSRGL